MGNTSFKYNYFYKILNKDYYNKLCNFDGSPKKISYDDNYILDVVAKNCNTTPDVVKECVLIYYDILIQKMKDNKYSIGSLNNPYIYLVCNNEDVFNSKSSIINFNNESQCFFVYYSFVSFLKTLSSYSDMQQLINDNLDDILDLFYKEFMNHLTKRMFGISHTVLLSNNKLFYYWFMFRNAKFITILNEDRKNRRDNIIYDKKMKKFYGYDMEIDI